MPKTSDTLYTHYDVMIGYPEGLDIEDQERGLDRIDMLLDHYMSELQEELDSRQKGEHWGIKISIVENESDIGHREEKA